MFGPLASRKVVGVEMAYAFHQQSSFQPGSNRAEVSQIAETEKVLRFGQSGCLLERGGGAEAALPRYRQMPRYRRQVWREMLSFFILDWSFVRFMPRRAAAPEGSPSPHGLPATPAGYARAQRL